MESYGYVTGAVLTVPDRGKELNQAVNLRILKKRASESFVFEYLPTFGQLIECGYSKKGAWEALNLSN